MSRRFVTLSLRGQWGSAVATMFALRRGSSNDCHLHVCRSLKEGIQCLDACFYSSSSTLQVDSFDELCAVAATLRRQAMEQIVVRFRASGAVDQQSNILEHVEDLPQWILRLCPLDVAARCGEQLEGLGPLTSENAVIECFVHWWLEQFVRSSVSSTEEYVPVLLLLGALTSFRRWVEGVACDSGRLVLRRLHGMHCPSTPYEERAYQPLLHWLQDVGARGGATSNVLQLCGGCNGGYLTDMLLKGGATSLLCAGGGGSPLSSASTEQAVKDHWRQKRSSRVGRSVTVMELSTNESLPAVAKVSNVRSPDEAKVRKSDVGKVSEAHAAERRRRARGHRNGVMLELPNDVDAGLVSPVSLLCYHSLTNASLVPNLLSFQHGRGSDLSGLFPCRENGTEDAIARGVAAYITSQPPPLI